MTEIVQKQIKLPFFSYPSRTFLEVSLNENEIYTSVNCSYIISALRDAGLLDIDSICVILRYSLPALDTC